MSKLFDEDIKAKLVFDGKKLIIPEDLMPQGLSYDHGWTKIKAAKQLEGSPKEQLCELAGRTCYDSLGQGRNSKQYWEHIRQVRHFSVIEHAYYTIEALFDTSEMSNYFLILFNRRGVWVSPQSMNQLRITLNLRALLEWDKWTKKTTKTADWLVQYANVFGDELYALVQSEAPLILPAKEIRKEPKLEIRWNHRFGYSRGFSLLLTEPMLSTEAHISMFLSGSRGWSHEQVRHRENISQRSTRYVDEDNSPWVMHPLIAAYLQETKKTSMPFVFQTIDTARQAYKETVSSLQNWLLSKGVDKLTARKQARGAARGYLGNALKTEMIFTTSVDGWKEIIRQRLSPAADAEIRHVYAMVLDELKKSEWGGKFDNFSTVPAEDGLGVVLKEI